MPFVIVARTFEHVVSAEETTKYPEGWTGFMPVKLARALERSGHGRVDSERQAAAEVANSAADKAAAEKEAADKAAARGGGAPPVA